MSNINLSEFFGASYSGPIGYTGSKGIDGTIGVDGYTGSQGAIGYTGSASTIDGPTGYTGSKGDQGVNGYTGSKGDQGIQGYTGSKGDHGIPPGGTQGQILSKVSNSDFDTEWLDLSASTVRTITASGNILLTDGIIVANASSPITLTLPTSVGNTSKSFLIKNLGTSTVTIQTVNNELIDIYTSITIEFQNSSLELASIETGWIIY